MEVSGVKRDGIKETDTDKLPVKQIIQEAIKKTQESSLWVLKKLTVYFACYYIPLAIAFLWTVYAFWIPPSFVPARIFLPMILTMTGMAFAVFITSYYVYRFNEIKSSNKSFPNQKSESTQISSIEPFLDFVKENVTPLVINHIKKFFVVLGYFFLLIVPGLVKIVRLTFVTQATFFDSSCRKGELSALKASHDLTKGFFFVLVTLFTGLIIVLGGLSELFKYSLKLAFGFESAFSVSMVESFGLTLSFYMQNLVLIFLTQLYFSLKKAKNLL